MHCSVSRNSRKWRKGRLCPNIKRTTDSKIYSPEVFAHLETGASTGRKKKVWVQFVDLQCRSLTTKWIHCSCWYHPHPHLKKHGLHTAASQALRLSCLHFILVDSWVVDVLIFQHIWSLEIAFKKVRAWVCWCVLTPTGVLQKLLLLVWWSRKCEAMASSICHQAECCVSFHLLPVKYVMFHHLSPQILI